MLSKCTVTGPFNRPDGKPFANARLTFKLSGRDREDDTIVMPSPVSVTTDADGDFSVELWPNSEGYAGTSYTASVVGYPQFRVVVPDAPTAKLALIMDLVPSEPVSDWQAALDEVRGIGAQVGELQVPVEALYADLETLNGLYAIRAEMVGVYAVRVAVAGVYAISDEVQAVYAVRSQIVSVADNMAAILAAQGYAQTATDGAAEATAARDVAVATTWVRFSPGPIYNDLGVPLGGYSCELYAYRATLQTRVVGKIRQSGPNASVTFYYAVDEAMVAGPFTATVALPVDEAVSFPVPVGSEVRMHITAMSGNVLEFETASYGAIA